MVFALTQIISNEFHVKLFTHSVNLKTQDNFIAFYTIAFW